ncbi:phosphatase PAP2 family protein [Rhodoferax bucti]|uniref:phosphatase PAP2 family protein n=1 Tax=Rhodoferax bucti TaxID=2576305 RepID=UPI0011083686|nr:phosphatase PAP2 family protein [Rhodoferax bucti]
MLTSETARRWLYDWGGANVEIFLAIQRSLPEGWNWLPELLSAIGSYWGAPAVVVLLLVWQRLKIRQKATPLSVPMWRFVLAFPLAMATGALAKAFFALPRPFVLLGDSVYRAASAPDSRYTLPSGHSVYVGVLVAALWPELGRTGRTSLLLFAAAVGWSRIVLGAHYPADVIAGFALGWSCVAAVGPWAQRFVRGQLFTGANR